MVIYLRTWRKEQLKEDGTNKKLPNSLKSCFKHLIIVILKVSFIETLSLKISCLIVMEKLNLLILALLSSWKRRSSFYRFLGLLIILLLK